MPDNYPDQRDIMDIWSVSNFAAFKRPKHSSLFLVCHVKTVILPHKIHQNEQKISTKIVV